MSRRLVTILLIVFAVLLVGMIGLVAVVLNGNRQLDADQSSVVGVPSPTEAAAIVVPTISATATAPSGPTAVATESATPNATPVTVVRTIPATAVSVASTSVQYVMAQRDLNIRSGPGTVFGVAGWLAEGQVARVTGISNGGDWWRVVCPDGSTGSCWVSAGTQYTRPTSSPGGDPGLTGVPTTCVDSATLVADITVPDGTQFEPNVGFNKIWRVRNSGTCTWEDGYRLVHAGGHLMGAVSTYFPLRDAVFPGQSVDLIINMISPATRDTYQSDWKLQNPQGQYFGVGRNNSPIWVKIVVIGTANTAISGVVYQDSNQNGVYDSGEVLLGSRVVWLLPGTACHVRQDPLTATVTDASGRYTLRGNFSGNYCVGLNGDNGLDDVAGLAVTTGQTLENVNLRAPLPSGSISGFVWNDYCLTGESGEVLAGNCVADEHGHYQANAMIEPTETYIPGITVSLQSGICSNNNAVSVAAVTDTGGRYFFGNLGPGNYCLSIYAASPENAAKLLPGKWTFPGNDSWYQDVLILTNENAYPINFGWDYQLK